MVGRITDGRSGAGKKAALAVTAVVVVFVLIVIANPFTVVPAGHVGVKDFFGRVAPDTLAPGFRIVLPFTRVVKMSVRTQELKEMAETPSREGLIIGLEVSVLFRLDPEKAVAMYTTVGSSYDRIVVEPQMRSAIREVTASYDAKVLYSSERERIAQEIEKIFIQLSSGRGIITEQVLLRKIALPPVVANAIQEKLKREQEAEQMKFVLQKEQQEAERKRIEAQGIADFQKIVTAGISPQLLEWKGIEATEKLVASPNAKIIVIGNTKTGLPLVFSGDTIK